MGSKRKLVGVRDQAKEFEQAFDLLSGLVDLDEADCRHPLRENAVYTSSVVLWMLVYQRMNPDSSLEAAVKKLIDSKPKLLPDNKRVREGSLSSNTSSYSQARSRLPRIAAEWFAEQVSQSLIDLSPPTFGNQRVFLIDGTTITLSPVPELRKAFPPASNHHGPGVWPVALLVVAHEVASGAALNPEIGAMYGENAVSETALIHQHLQRLPPDSLVMADAGYGMFSVAYATRQAGHSLLLRMTQQRFNALRRNATLITHGDVHRTWSYSWQPSPKERSNHPDLPQDARLDVHLHDVVLSPDVTLHLVTDVMNESAATMAEVYRQRGHVETDIRNLKIVLDTENLRARSVEMFQKELLTAMVSYNLVTQFRRHAAQLIGRAPRDMSFKRTWTTFRQFLLTSIHGDPAHWRQRYDIALKYATQDKLPNRPGRKYEREAYSRRPKCQQFKKRKPPPP